MVLGWLFGLILGEYLPLAFQNPYLIIAHSVARTPHLSHFEKMSFLQSILSHFCLCIYLIN